MRIQHNIMAMNAYRNYNTNTSALSKNLEKLSSGYKINRAGDDAAGLAISEKMRAQITGLNAAQKNVKDGISLVKTAEGAMQEIQDMLNRMDYLATQSANGTYDNEVDRANLQKEVNALRTEIDRIADSANFNGIKLLDGKQASKAEASTSTISVGVTTSAVSAGSAITPAVTKTGAELDANFAPSTADNKHDGLHPGEASASFVAASFSIDLKGIVLSGVTSATADANKDTLTITIGDGSITVSVNDTTGAGVTGSGVAGLLDGKAITIGGVSFSMTKDGTTVKFTTTKANADGKANDINAQIKGAEVKIGIKDTAVAGATPSINDNWTHGLQDITYAVDTKAADLGGISFKLDDKVVKDGNELTIGDKTFKFAVGDSSAVTKGNADYLIKIKTGDYADAARQIAQSATDITDPAKAGAFKISAIKNDGTIHVDQKAPATGEAPAYNEAALKGLFTLVTPAGTKDQKATITITPDAVNTGVTAGDMVKYKDNTYTIGEPPEGTKEKDKASYMTAASFNAMVQSDVLNSVKDALTDEFGTNYNVAVTAGKIVVTAKAGNAADTADALKAKVAAAKDAVASISISKIDADKVGQGGLQLQIGDTSDSFNQMSVQIGDMHVDAMGIMENSAVKGGAQTVKTSIAEIDISKQDGARAAIDVIKGAINYVSGIRGDLGAIQNRLEHTQNNLSVMAENIQDAESTIRDTDVANEMMSYVKNNILVQSAQAMLAQANQVPQGVLQLLG